MFDSVLIADRGPLACAVSRRLGALGLQTIAIHSAGDRYAPHVLASSRSVCVGPADYAHSYGNGGAILDAARITGARAIHPGAGALAANAEFREAAEKLGIAWIGPSSAALRAAHQDSMCEIVRRLGLRCDAPGVHHARRIDVPVIADTGGTVVTLADVDASAECADTCLFMEAPAIHLPAFARAAIRAAAIAVAAELRLDSLGTISFLYDTDRNEPSVSCVRPHLGLEHLLAEALYDVDLLDWMLRNAAGESVPIGGWLSEPRGHAFAARIFAHDPARAFQPSRGLVTQVHFLNELRANEPTMATIRAESAIEPGTLFAPEHDPLIACVVVSAPDRDQALTALRSALDAARVGGIETNLPYVRQILADPLFVAGELTTRSLERFVAEASGVEVLSPGAQTIVVDYPGRIGFWDVGVPPSGPIDPLAHRLANRVVGNSERCATLEMTLAGPKLRFRSDATIALAGASLTATLDGEPAPYFRPVRVRAGQVLAVAAVSGPGCRAYLAIRGGIDVPEYLGSKTTFTLGGFGGHAGRALREGDVLHVGADSPGQPAAVPHELIPRYGSRWQIGVLYGPHGAPDFFTPADIETLFSADWEVHFNSNRTGIRLLGPKPDWARPDGGEAGLHPSNIHDVAYAIGAIDFTGDMPILLGPDGPSLGGFVCPATVVDAELWKLGQIKAGDRVRFVPITAEAALNLQHAQSHALSDWRVDAQPQLIATAARQAVVSELPATDESVRVVYRPAGDRYLLVEYGPLVLDLRLRFRVHALMTWLEKSRLEGIVDLTPGIRSLQIHYDPTALSQRRLLDVLQLAERELTSFDDEPVPTRTIHLPLSWDDPATRLAIDKYMRSVRPDAPWCPSNIEFIRRINGLESVSDVYDIVFGASYLVLGLGDVYLGAPVATPLDPRHRLVTTKYNPARTWTAENSVGIGGAYLCIYGMEGPGGYQFVGRTLQVYNRFKQTRDFCNGKPWLLRFFDQLRFYPVSAETLLDMREAFPHGKVELRVEQGTFRLSEYQQTLRQNAASIATFKAKQQAAFEAERDRWIQAGQLGPTRPVNERKPTRPSNAGAERRTVIDMSAETP